MARHLRTLRPTRRPHGVEVGIQRIAPQQLAVLAHVDALATHHQHPLRAQRRRHPMGNDDERAAAGHEGAFGVFLRGRVQVARSGTSTPASSAANDDLPMPLGPTTATWSPGGKEGFKPSTMGVAEAP